MKHEWHGGKPLLSETGSPDEIAGMVGAFFGPDLPADNISAEDVKYQVKEEEQSFYRPFKIGDIPGPYLIWCGSPIRCWFSVFTRFFAAAAVILLFLLMENAIHGSFRGDIFSPVCKSRNDLARRKISKLFAVNSVQYFLALL